MKTKSPHHVLTDAEVRTPLRRLAHVAMIANPAALIAAFAAPVMAGFLPFGPSSYSGAAVFFAVVYAVLFIICKVGAPPELAALLASRYEPLEARELDSLRNIAVRSPEVRAWVGEAMQDGRVFRRRDLDAAYAALDHARHNSALSELQRRAGIEKGEQDA
ncbi:hypothetical protein O5F62_004755 [Salmonella enterica]|nr:hypothetical protein [Salmonella enterica]